MIKAVIFDMDGVIVDSEPIETRARERLLSEFGKKPIYNNVGLLQEVGVVGMESWKNFLKKHHINENPEVLRDRKREIFRELIKNGITPMPASVELIKTLKKKKIKLALASSRFFKQVILLVETLGMKDLFDAIIGPSEKIKHKPHPDIYLESARALQISPAFCVAIEDSETGVLSAIAAGMKVIAIPNKYTKHQNFSKADRIVDSLSEITIPILKSL